MFELNEFVENLGRFPECPLFPKAVVQISENGANSRSAYGHKRSFASCIFLRVTESIGINDADEPTCAENDHRNSHY